jgi:hypothetical protein
MFVTFFLRSITSATRDIIHSGISTIHSGINTKNQEEIKSWSPTLIKMRRYRKKVSAATAKFKAKPIILDESYY